MAGPGDEKAAGTTGRGHLRASDADREHVIDTLKAAFAQGRLTKNEFDQRIGQTFASRTYAELAMVTADIPAGLTRARPLPKPARARARRPVNKAVAWGAWGLITPAIFAGVLADNPIAWGLLAPLSFLYFIGWLSAGIVMLASWHQKLTRSGSAGIPVGQTGAQPLRKPAKARARAAKAAAWGLYGIVMPAAFTVAVIPGNAPVGVVVVTAAVICLIFWLLGAVVMRRGWTRPS